MSYKKCPSGKTLVRSYKAKSGKRIKSFCRAKPAYKSSRIKKVKSIKKTIKKSKSVSRPKSPRKSVSRPKSPRKSSPRNPVIRVRRSLGPPEVGIKRLKQVLDKITGSRILTNKEIDLILKQYSAKFNQCIPKEYEIKKFIGKGENGSVYLICKNFAGPNEKCKIIKIQETNNEDFIAHEIKMQRIFHAIGLAPKIYNTCKFMMKEKQYIVIEMEPIVGTLDTMLRQKLQPKLLKDLLVWTTNVLKLLCTKGLTHGDYHWGNIGYNIKPDGTFEPILIDFSWSSNKGCNPRLEYIQLLRTATFKHIHPDNKKYLEDNLFEIYTKEFNRRLRKNNNSYDQEWNNIMNKYVKVM